MCGVIDRSIGLLILLGGVPAAWYISAGIKSALEGFRDENGGDE